jgi:hypothetical protein
MFLTYIISARHVETGHAIACADEATLVREDK